MITPKFAFKDQLMLFQIGVNMDWAGFSLKIKLLSYKIDNTRNRKLIWCADNKQ